MAEQTMYPCGIVAQGTCIYCYRDQLTTMYWGQLVKTACRATSKIACFYASTSLGPSLCGVVLPLHVARFDLSTYILLPRSWPMLHDPSNPIP